MLQLEKKSIEAHNLYVNLSSQFEPCLHHVKIRRDVHYKRAKENETVELYVFLAESRCKTPPKQTFNTRIFLISHLNNFCSFFPSVGVVNYPL